MKIAFLGATLVAAAGAMLALRIVIQSYLGERDDFVRTPPAAISEHPESTGIAGLAEVSFAADGRRIAGWYVPSRSRAAVVLVHGTGADRSSLLNETRFLARAGFGVLAIDLPGQGMSEGRTLWGVPERRAISAAVDWLTLRPDVDAARIGGYGLSMGAYILTQAAVLDRRLRAVVLASTPADVVEQNWQATKRCGWLSQIPTYLALRASGMPLDMRPRDVIGQIAPRPVLLLQGTLDTTVPPVMAQELYDNAQQPKSLWMVSGVHHADYMDVAPHEYPRRVVAYFQGVLLD